MRKEGCQGEAVVGGRGVVDWVWMRSLLMNFRSYFTSKLIDIDICMRQEQRADGKPLVASGQDCLASKCERQEKSCDEKGIKMQVHC